MRKGHIVFICTVSTLALSGSAAWAQNASTDLPAASASQRQDANALSDEGIGDIIVTARKRNESAISVPISIQAFGAKDLAKYDTKSFENLAKQVPGFALQTNYNPTATVYLRGIGSVPQNSTGEQSVGVVLDEVSTGGSGMLRTGQIDVAEVEVLKGPQPLFFGKNTTAGVVSVHSADPTDHQEASVIASYGLEDRDKSIQAVLSGPITDNLKLRLVGYGDYSDGFFKNDAAIIPGNRAALGPSRDRGPYRKEQLVRLTALYTPAPDLSIRAKYMFNNAHTGSPLEHLQRFYCVNGTPSIVGIVVPDTCEGDRHTPSGRFVPAITAQIPGNFYFQGLRFRQHLGVINIRHDSSNGLTITSDMGIYSYREDSFGNSGEGSIALLYGGAHTRRKNFTEELRLSTPKDRPLSLTMGFFFQNKREIYQSLAVLDAFSVGAAPVPGILGTANNTPGIYYPKSKAYSTFLQATWNLTDRLELAGGARYSQERKRIVITTDGGTIVPNVRPKINFNNVSPEVTLTFRPTQRLTVYGGYREGYKSGGFNTAPGGSLVADRTFRPERASGFEAGLKARVGDVRFNVAGYNYTYRNLQVSRFNTTTVSFTLQNAARARVKGIEGDFNWQPAALRGFDLHGAVNYNKARYLDFIGSCYIGQTIAEGCNQLPGPSGNFTSQNLAGRPTPDAPLWTGSLGVGYSQEVGDLKLGGTFDGYYSSAYYGQFEEAPFGQQQRNLQLNASVRVGASDDRWQLALIGKNLTNIYRTFLVTQAVRTGNSALTGTNTPGGRPDLAAYFNPGRQISLQLTTKF